MLQQTFILLQHQFYCSAPAHSCAIKLMLKEILCGDCDVAFILLHFTRVLFTALTDIQTNSQTQLITVPTPWLRAVCVINA